MVAMVENTGNMGFITREKTGNGLLTQTFFCECFTNQIPTVWVF